MRACVPGGVRVCMSVRACSLAYPAYNSYAPYCDVICDPYGSTILVDIISSTAIFSKNKKVIKNKICVLIFSTTFV